MEKFFLEKVFYLVFGRIGMGAIFLFGMVFLWVQMQDALKQHDEWLLSQLKGWQNRFEKLEEKHDRSMTMHMKTIEECCRYRSVCERVTK